MIDEEIDLRAPQSSRNIICVCGYVGATCFKQVSPKSLEPLMFVTFLPCPSFCRQPPLSNRRRPNAWNPLCLGNLKYQKQIKLYLLEATCVKQRSPKCLEFLVFGPFLSYRCQTAPSFLAVARIKQRSPKAWNPLCLGNCRSTQIKSSYILWKLLASSRRCPNAWSPLCLDHFSHT